MLLEKLIDECPVEYGKTEILSLALRADECSKNSLFFCLNGSTTVTSLLPKRAQKALHA